MLNSADPLIPITTYKCFADNNPVRQQLTWSALVALLSTFQEVEDKTRSPSWSPAIFESGLPRKDEHVVAVTALVFDMDGLSTEALSGVEERLAEAGFSYILHSSHSNAPPDDWCLRLVLRVSRHIKPSEFPKVWRAFVDTYQIPADEKAKNISRLYGLPACPVGSSGVYEYVEGEVVDIDALLATVSQGFLSPSAAEPAPVTTLAGVRESLTKVRRKEHAEWIRRALNGEPLAPSGERDDTLQRACGFLAHRFSEVPSEVLVHILAPSLVGMAAPEGYQVWHENALDKLERAKERKAASDAAAREANESFLKTQRLLASGGKSSGPYTQEEVEQWAADAGCTFEEFSRRWIIQYDRAYFIFREGQYDPGLRREAAENTFRRDLSRASDFVALSGVTASGAEKPLKLSEVVERHGTVAHAFRYSYLESTSQFDADTRTLTLAVAPPRTVAPKYDAQIEHWLGLIGGAEKERFFDWLATFPQLDRPTAALYLRGPPGAGKDLFFLGLSRLWSTQGPTYLSKDHFGSFNDPWMRCPLLVVNEAMPGVSSSESLDGLMRKLIMDRSQTLRQKNLPTAEIDGALRVILASNNDNLLSFAEAMTEDALNATAERYLYLKLSTAPGQYLASLGGLRTTEAWVDGDGIAAHVMWLAANRKVTPYGRLLVSGTLDEMRAKLETSAGVASPVCEFILKCLLDENLRKAHLHVGCGEVWININKVLDPVLWNANVSGVRAPKKNDAVEALQAISLKDERSNITARFNGKQLRFWRLDVNTLIYKALDWKDADREEILEIVNKENEDMRSKMERMELDLKVA